MITFFLCYLIIGLAAWFYLELFVRPRIGEGLVIIVLAWPVILLALIIDWLDL